MIEKVVQEHLNRVLDIPTLLEKPEEEIQEYIIIEKTGGSRENHIQSATIAIKSHAASLFRAAEINKKAIDAMNCLAELPEIGSSEYNTDYNYTDISKKEYRYQAVYEV